MSFKAKAKNFGLKTVRPRPNIPGVTYSPAISQSMYVRTAQVDGHNSVVYFTKCYHIIIAMSIVQ